MNPAISNPSEEGDIYRFTLSGINVAFANAIRRTILSDIKINVIQTDTHEKNQCNILVNTGRLHNEILKHRLSCIPIHNKELLDFPGKYSLEFDLTNDTENIMFCTTEHFKLKNKETGKIDEDLSRKVFPPNAMTASYIDFARLRPAISDSIPGEQLKFTAEFSIGTAKQNSMYNVVSKCAYGNTPDTAKIAEVWEAQENKLKSDGLSEQEIEFQKRNYYLLDGQRQFVPDSYDFVLQTVGIYDNRELMQKACAVLQNKFIDMMQAIDSDSLPIFNSETTMDSCYDVLLEDEDYTMGKILEYILYEKYYLGEKTLSFCGFKKFHPHNSDSTIRIAFEKAADKNMARQYLREACVESQELFKRIYQMFK
jgi:DNA-directed RNA polymerase subunit L/DNA-directed RNA polymerase alpha subunit